MQPRRTRMPWTADQVDRLKQLHGHGQTFSELAEACGHPRNACITKARELKLPRRDRAEQCRRGYYRWRRDQFEVDRFMERDRREARP